MPAIRLIPKTDDAEFPYDAALALIQRLPGVVLRPADLAPMIAAGKRMGWPEAMVRANEALAARGKCWAFSWSGPPALTGTLYEDNVFLSVVDDEMATLKLIRSWATELNGRVFQH